MKAAVVVPPLQDFYFTKHRFACLGANIVKLICEKAGFNTGFFIFPESQKTSLINLPEDLKYLNQYLIRNEQGPLSWFYQFKHYGPGFKDAARDLADFKADIYFFSLFAWAYAEEACLLAKNLLAIKPDALLAIGGPGAAAAPRFFLNKHFNFVFTGEAESLLPDFLKRVRQNRNKLSGKIVKPKEIILNKAMAARPMAVAVPTVKKAKLISVSTLFSRGCPNSCRFCSVSLVHGKKLRLCKADDLFKSIEEIYNPRKKLLLNLEDDNLLLAKEECYSLLERLKQAFPLLLLAAENGMDYRLLSLTDLSRLIAFGFRKFNFTLASLDSGQMRQMKRKTDNGKLAEIIRFLNHAEIPAIVYAICAMPGDTEDKALASLAFLHRLPLQVALSPFYALPSLDLKSPYQYELNHKPGLCRATALWPWAESLSTVQMLSLLRLYRLSHLVKKSCYSSEEKELLDVIATTNKLHTFVREGTRQRIIEVTAVDTLIVKMAISDLFNL